MPPPRLIAPSCFAPATLACLLLVAACQPELPGVGAPVTALEWVQASARVHDPAGHWGLFAGEVTVARFSQRGTFRYQEELYIDRGADTFRRAVAGRDALLTQTVGPSGCTARWPGARDPSPDDLRRNGLTGEPCDVILPRRSFHEFLIGLPMSVLGPATRFGESPTETVVFGRPAVRVDLTFAEDPGGQAWFLFVDPDTKELLGAGFTTADDGGELMDYGAYEGFEGFRLARRRTLYDVSGEEFITEHRVRFEAVGE